MQKNKEKYIDISSFNYASIDELIKRLEEYKKQYGGESIINIDTYFQEQDSLPEIYYKINTKLKKEKTIDNNTIPKWCSHGKTKGNTYFKYEPQDNRHFWRCTHGGWSFESDGDGVILDTWFLDNTQFKHLRGLKIIKFFKTSEYMEEFGNDNPYEWN